MTGEVAPPGGISGFGNYLLWLIATRAAHVVDGLYREGPANATREFRMDDGHHLPTQAAVAWLLMAAARDTPAASLPRGDKSLSAQHKRLAETMRYALNDQPHLFKDDWLDKIDGLCEFSGPEVRLLRKLRLAGGVPIDPAALRKAVRKTRENNPPAHWDADQPGPDEIDVAMITAPGKPREMPPRAAPRMLPRDIDSFTGRHSELKRLTGAPRHPAGSTGATRVYAIEGMGGVGKTALAVRAAYLIAGRFPDGQLFADLHGYTQDVTPVTSTTENALRAMLRDLGVADVASSWELADLVAAYRNKLADTRTLIVLDNAANLEQVEQLLPGAAGCLVLVTSRHPLGLNGAQVIPLDVPSPHDAATIFRVAAGLGRIAPNDPNVSEIIQLCGCLPLAVAILGTRLARGRLLDTGHTLAELRRERRRLAELSDGARNVTAVLELSYQHMPEPTRRLFDRLGLVPGPDFDSDAATSLAEDGDVADVPSSLDSLIDHNLLLLQNVAGRYRFHDLVRVFARMKADSLGPGKPGALTRLLDFYLHTTQVADSRLGRRSPKLMSYLDVSKPRVVPELSTTAQAQAWLTAELRNLEAAIQEAASGDHPGHAVALAAALADHLRASGPWATAAELHRIAIDAAATMGDLTGEVTARVNLGVIQRQQGNIADAVDTLSSAVEAGRGSARRLALAGALLELGMAHRISREPARAVSAIEDALTVYKGEGSLLGEAAALRELGSLRRQQGQFTKAEESLRAALLLYQRIEDRFGEAATLNYLASLQVAVEAPYEETRKLLRDALRIYIELGDSMNQANSLLVLGSAHLDAGHAQLAIKDLTEARRIYRQLGDDRGQGNCLVYLGKAKGLLGRYKAAGQSLKTAIEFLQVAGDSGGEAEAWNHYGALALTMGDPKEARRRYEQALSIALEIESPSDARAARDGIARCDEAEGIAS